LLMKTSKKRALLSKKGKNNGLKTCLKKVSRSERGEKIKKKLRGMSLLTFCQKNMKKTEKSEKKSEKIAESSIKHEIETP